MPQHSHPSLHASWFCRWGKARPWRSSRSVLSTHIRWPYETFCAGLHLQDRLMQYLFFQLFALLPYNAVDICLCWLVLFSPCVEQEGRAGSGSWESAEQGAWMGSGSSWVCWHMAVDVVIRLHSLRLQSPMRWQNLQPVLIRKKLP